MSCRINSSLETFHFWIKHFNHLISPQKNLSFYANVRKVKDENSRRVCSGDEDEDEDEGPAEIAA